MKKYLLGTLALAAVIALPTASFAAMYAYVDQSGNVRTVEANTPAEAIVTAPSIAEHSGVILLDSASDSEVVGTSVQGT